MQNEMIKFLVSEFMDEVETGSDSITALISILEKNFQECGANYTSDKRLEPYNLDTYEDHIKQANLQLIGQELDKVALHEKDEDDDYRFYKTRVVVWKGGEE